MRTRLMRSKFSLLFLALAMLVAVPAVAYAADEIIADGDVATAGDNLTRNIGTVAPGATVTPNEKVNFTLDCMGNNHFNSNETADINFSSTGSSIKDAGGLTPSTGSVSATSLSNISGPTTWPNDGNNACPATNAQLGSSDVSIVAPKKAGTYTYTVAYNLNRDTGTANNELALAQGGGGPAADTVLVKYTLTVNNVAPVIDSFNGATSATEGNTESYTINASDANTDNLTYNLTKLSGPNVTITGGTTATPSVKFLAPGTVVLQSSVSDGVNTVTQSKTVTIASACTAPAVTTQPTDQTVTYNGANATFTAAASGTSPSVQWQKSTDNGTTWSNVSGATSTSLTVTNPSVSDSGSKYRAVFTNGCGSATSNAATLNVNPAAAQVTLNSADLNQTYDGNAKSVGTSTTPTGLSVDVTYDGSATAPTNAGTYDVVATVTNPNYQGSASGTLTIDKASQTINFGALADKTFGDADFQVSATGGGSSEPVTFAATGNCEVTGNTVHLTGAGTCTITASQAGNANYKAATSVEQSFTIDKASQAITFGALADKTFGDPNFGLNATADSGLTVSYSATGNCSIVGANSDQVSIDGAGTCTITASQAGNANYKAATSVEQSFTIDKATATIDVNGYTGTYDGNAHGATGTATGVGGADLNSLLNLGNSFTNAPGGTANWSFAGNGNYKAASGSVAIVINKADATIDVNGYTGTYDGNAHGATGTATGVNNENLNSLLNLGNSFTNVPGGTANWSFAGNGNYNSANGSVAIVINKATANVQLSGLGPYFYDGTPKAATATTSNPAGLNVTITYNGSTTAPTNVGSYNVVAKITENNYQGQATGTLVISPWTTKGFYAPVDMGGVYNTVKGGSTVPLKFELFSGATELTDPAQVKSLTATKTNCDPDATQDAIEVTATGGTSLRYDSTGGQFIYNWKTPTGAGCYTVTLTAQDGSTITAYFKSLK